MMTVKLQNYYDNTGISYIVSENSYYKDNFNISENQGFYEVWDNQMFGVFCDGKIITFFFEGELFPLNEILGIKSYKTEETYLLEINTESKQMNLQTNKNLEPTEDIFYFESEIESNFGKYLEELYKNESMKEVFRSNYS